MGVARFADYAYAQQVKFDNTPEGRQLLEDRKVARRKLFRKLIRFFIWSYGFGLIVAFFELPLGMVEVCLLLLIMGGLIKVYPKKEAISQYTHLDAAFGLSRREKVKAKDL